LQLITSPESVFTSFRNSYPHRCGINIYIVRNTQAVSPPGVWAGHFHGKDINKHGSIHQGDRAIIESVSGDVAKAAEAERRIIEELRQMGNEVLHGWARRQQQKKAEEYNAKPGVNRKEKKTSTGTRD
jgi:hypothetical protein